MRKYGNCLYIWLDTIVLLYSLLILGIDTVRRTINEIPVRDVARIVNLLKNKFSSLVARFCHISRLKIVYIEDLTAIIKTQLVDHYGRDSPEVMVCLQEIHLIQSTDEYYDFLRNKGYLGYLNYGLLRPIAEILNEKSLIIAINGYQSSYKKLLKEPSIKEMMHVFIHDPSLCPSSAIGLPEIVFDLDNPWPEKSVITWDEYYYTKFPWAKSTLMQQMEKKCIRLRYAVLPCVYDDILDNIHNEQLVKELKRNNITLSLRTKMVSV